MLRGESSNVHTIDLANAYGEVIATERFDDGELPDTLRRFYHHALQCRSAIVTLDGIVQTRNSFLEFVREFEEACERSARLDRLSPQLRDLPSVRPEFSPLRSACRCAVNLTHPKETR